MVTKEPTLPWIEGKCTFITITPSVDVRCLNWATHHPKLCTIHDPALKCSIPGCKQFKTNIDPVADLCYIHANPEDTKYIQPRDKEDIRFVHDIPHGSYLKYKQNCRCPKCKEAKRIYESMRRTKQALLKLGDLAQAKQLELDLNIVYYGEADSTVSQSELLSDSDLTRDTSERPTVRGPVASSDIPPPPDF